MVLDDETILTSPMSLLVSLRLSTLIGLVIFVDFLNHAVDDILQSRFRVLQRESAVIWFILAWNRSKQFITFAVAAAMFVHDMELHLAILTILAKDAPFLGTSNFEAALLTLFCGQMFNAYMSCEFMSVSRFSPTFGALPLWRRLRRHDVRRPAMRSATASPY